ncbi:TBC1 domain family member 8B-like [Xiphophorus maculatus]|nr:TBC1 domain family member 8B-like [Xiphophorus maculatus]
MRRRSSSSASWRSSTDKRRSEGVGFDEFGFAFTNRREQKLHHRCHDYSYPQLSLVRVKELCELLSYWNGASFICKSQIERFIRMGIPPSLRGRVWKCLLNVDGVRECSDFNYQTCLLEVRGPLVDLGVSEYGILSAIATLSDTQNDLGLNQRQLSGSNENCYSIDEITLFRQIALDLQRSFPTHQSLMGQSSEAIEGQAKLFRVLVAYAKYNPQVGYSQGMSYIVAVLLMHLGEEEAFWALTALLGKSKYLAELFDLSLTKVQHQVKVFDQFLKHRKARLSKHLDSAGVLLVHFVMPWFLTLFTSLPCWDSVLAVWDLIILQGLQAVFRTSLTIIELLEPRLMELNDEGAMLPLLLRVPVDMAQYTVLVSALWKTEVQDWELKCMNSLVLDESHHEPKTEKLENPQNMNNEVGTENETRHISKSGGKKTSKKDTVPEGVSLMTRVMRMVHRHLLSPLGRQGVEEKCSQTLAVPRHRSPGHVFRSRASASFTQAQVRLKRQSKQKSSTNQPEGQGSGGEVAVAPVTGKKLAGCGKSERYQQTFKRSGTGSVGKVAHRRSNHTIHLHARAKSRRLPQNEKSSVDQNPNSSAILSSTLPRSSSPTPSSPQSTNASQSGEPHETINAALIRELSSRHQTSLPFLNARGSKLI